tara:strand:- start:28 stop:1152 length:1125 start_codon:yes stop_codon:yes gene_type:complete
MLKNFGTKTATELTYLGKAKDLVSGIPLVGKYFEAFGKGAGKGIEALETVSKYPDRKYGVNMFNDPQFNKYVKDAGITKDQPLKLAGAYTARVLGDVLTDETRKFYWRFNHPLAIADELLQKAVDPTKTLQRYQRGVIGLAAIQPAVAVTGAYDPTNLLELGRPKGFKQNTPTQEDKTKTANPATELFQRFVQGRTGRPLAYADAQKEIPDLTKRRYANYLNFLYNNPDPLGKATGGFIKTTRENLQGNPEARFLGYPVSIPAVGGVIGGLTGARTAIMTSPDVKVSVGKGQVATTQLVIPNVDDTLSKKIKPEKLLTTPQTGKGKARLIGRAMAGGLAGSVPGILAGKLANQALARSDNDKASSLAGNMNPYK